MAGSPVLFKQRLPKKPRAARARGLRLFFLLCQKDPLRAARLFLRQPVVRLETSEPLRPARLEASEKVIREKIVAFRSGRGGRPDGFLTIGRMRLERLRICR